MSALTDPENIGFVLLDEVERRFDPGQLRDDNGRWTDGPGGAATSYAIDEFIDLYGDLHDEAKAGDLVVSVTDRGDMVLSHEDEHGRRTPIFDDLDPDKARSIADDVDWAAAEGIPDDAESDPKTRLVDWRYTEDDILVGYDPSGDVSIRFPKSDDAKPENLGDFEVIDVGAADATDLAEALRDMADRREELDAEAERAGGPVSGRTVEELRQILQRKFNVDQLRDPGGEHGGQWVKSPGAAAEAAGKDLLKLAGKIDLDHDEKLVGSAKLDGDMAGARFALTEQHGKRMLRVGFGGEGYGKRDRDEGIPAWDGNPSRKPLSDADRDRLNAEDDDLIAEYDDASPARQEEIDNRRADIREQLTADDIGFNGTANLDEYSTKRLIDRIGPALDEAVDQERVENAAWDEIEALEAKGNPDPARLAELREKAHVGMGGITFVEGIVPGSDWGDVHFRVELDDVTVGPQVILGVMPKGAPENWGDDKDWMGQFNTHEARKLLKLLDKFSGTASRSREVSRRYAADGGGTRTGQETTTGPKGGQFAPGGGRITGHGKPAPKKRPAKKAPAKPAGPLGFDGKTGAGYGIKGGDPRVRTLQSVLNRLGLTDSGGNELAVDGKFGPRTTAAVKKLQKALGVEANGKVTEDFIKQVANLHALPQQPKPKPRPARKRVRRSSSMHDFDNGICRTCQPHHEHVLDNGICTTCPA